MAQVLVTLKDDEQLKAFVAFVEQLRFVEKVEERVNGYKEEIPPFKDDYTTADIEAIARQFPANKKWTYTELARVFPDDLKVKVEILNNELFIMPSPSLLHQRVSNRLSLLLTNFTDKYGLGEVLVAPMDVKFNEDNVQQPDLLFVSIKRTSIMKAQYVEGAPDLVVEIMSPSNDLKERTKKHELYESEGVLEYWTIFPKQRHVKVEVLQDGCYETFSETTTSGNVRSSVLKGFELELKDIMPDRFFVEG